MPLFKMSSACACLLVTGILSGCTSFDQKVAESLREQAARNEAAKPLLDAVVAKKLKIGDSIERAKEVLSDAGLTFEVDKIGALVLRSIYRTGDGCGITIALEIDSEQRISKIDIREVYTGP
jgi:hypothetical protein